jgi:hypothetical protein
LFRYSQDIKRNRAIMQPPSYDKKNKPFDSRISTARRKRDNRIGAGCDPLIAGWQCFLEELLIRLETHLVPGKLASFQALDAADRHQFRKLQDSLILPPHVSGIYIPPAVLNGVIPSDYREKKSGCPAHIPSGKPDGGIVLACQHREYRLIINALLAQPPDRPGIDVYTEGQLMADYGYTTVGECQEYMQPVIWTHLHTHVDLPSLI